MGGVASSLSISDLPLLPLDSLVAPFWSPCGRLTLYSDQRSFASPLSASLSIMSFTFTLLGERENTAGNEQTQKAALRDVLVARDLTNGPGPKGDTTTCQPQNKHRAKEDNENLSISLTFSGSLPLHIFRNATGTNLAEQLMNGLVGALRLPSPLRPSSNTRCPSFSMTLQLFRTL